MQHRANGVIYSFINYCGSLVVMLIVSLRGTILRGGAPCLGGARYLKGAVYLGGALYLVCVPYAGGEPVSVKVFDDALKMAEIAFTNEATTLNIALRISLIEEPS